jgi:hypothetical protein
MAPRRAVACALLVLAAGCSYRVATSVSAPVRSETSVSLYGHELRLHLSRPPAASAQSVLLVYATGDGGWWGGDRDLFAHLTTWGYPAVGFSAREYVHHLDAAPVTPAELAHDYKAIIDTAVTALELPSPLHVVLVGKSRGAGLSLAAALDPGFNAAIDGIVAAGLTREEEYVHGRTTGSGAFVMIDTYAKIRELGRLPLAVIQSTNDHYAPAAKARALFGPDTPDRELIPIVSRDHNFGGALDLLYQEMEQSVHWILSR